MALSSSSKVTLPDPLCCNNNNHNNHNKPTLRGVIFDMDGTLTILNLDFAEMYRRCGVDKRQDILQAIATMDEASAARATAIVEEMEEQGRQTLQLMPGTVSVLQWLAFHQIPTALVTRNTFASTQRLLELIVQDANHANNDAQVPLSLFSPIIARDHQPTIPPKPHTAALEYIAQQWKVNLSNELVMVGDSPANDIEFGKNAGVSTALLWQTATTAATTTPTAALGGADMVVSHLAELPLQLFQRFHIAKSTRRLPYDSSAPKTPPLPTTEAGRAAYRGDLTIIQSMSLHQLFEKDTVGNTPLIWAAEGGHEQVIQSILDSVTASQANILESYVNARGFRGATALSRATRHGHIHVVHVLLSHKLYPTCTRTVNIPNVKLQYPLHVAAFRQHLSIVQVLLEAGADPHVVDHKGRTPLADTTCPRIQQLLSLAPVK